MEQNHLDEAEAVFRKDLKFHPRNPWALVGLINTLKKKEISCCNVSTEVQELEAQLQTQRQSSMADVEVKVACACCQSET